MTDNGGTSFADQLEWFNNANFSVLKRRDIIRRNQAFRFATADEIKQINVEQIWNALIKKRWQSNPITIGQTLKVTQPPETPFERPPSEMKDENYSNIFPTESPPRPCKRQCIRSNNGDDLFGDIDDDIFNQIDLTNLTNVNANAQNQNGERMHVQPQFGYNRNKVNGLGGFETMHELRTALKGKSKTAKYKIFAQQNREIKQSLKQNSSIPPSIKTKICRSLQGKVNKIKQSIPDLYDAMENYIKCKQNNDFSCYQEKDDHKQMIQIKKKNQARSKVQTNDAFNMSGLDLFGDMDDAMFAQIDF